MDRKFWPDEPEPGFSVKRNKQVIAKTIKEYEKQRAKKRKEFRDKLKYRTDAAATYLTGRRGLSRSLSVEKYFGKQELARLRGEEIVNRLLAQQKMMISNNKKAQYEQKEKQKELAKEVLTGKGYKIKRNNAEEE